MADAITRAAALAMIRRGEITMAEAAWLAGVSRQAVAEWCERHRIDAPAARVRWLHERWARSRARRELSPASGIME